MPFLEAPAAPEPKLVAPKQKSEVAGNKPAKVLSTLPQSPPPMPAAPPKPAEQPQPPVSPYAPTVPQQAYKQDSFGEIHSMVAGTPERTQATPKRTGPRVAAIVVVLLVIAALLFLALR